MMKKLLLSILSMMLPLAGYSTTLAEQQAQSFMSIYRDICLNYMNRYDELRRKLAPMPELPPEKAAAFLNGAEGSAWPVPDDYGTFVLVLYKKQNFCAVYARQLDTKTAQTLFSDFLNDAPEPIVVQQKPKKRQQNTAHGTTETIAYQWGAKGAPLQMLFMLTTAPESDELQAFASTSIISK